MELPPRLNVSMSQILDDTLNLFPGDSIPAEAGVQMHKVVEQLATLHGLIQGVQKYLGPSIILAREGNNEMLEKVFELLLSIDTTRNQSPKEIKMSTITLAVGRENETKVTEMCGNTIIIGLRGDGSVGITIPAKGNTDMRNKPMTADVFFALTPEQTRDLAKELLRLQP